METPGQTTSTPESSRVFGPAAGRRRSSLGAPPGGPPNPMSYDPRTIAYMAELIHQPMQLAADKVQTIHNALFGDPSTSYQNFQIAPDGIHLSNVAQQPGSVSSVSFGPDRIVLREELRATTLEDFATRVVHVAKVSFQTLGVQASLAQQFVVRSLVTPRSAQDSREFMARKVFGASEDKWSAFQRPMQTIGMSFMFPQTGTDNQVFRVRIETWNQDPRSLWIENVGSFTQPVLAERVPDLGNLLHSTYGFVTGPVSEFLAQFDG